MKYIFKKLNEIDIDDKYGGRIELVAEMEHLFDGVTERNIVCAGEDGNNLIYEEMDDDNNVNMSWFIKKEWIKKVSMRCIFKKLEEIDRVNVNDIHLVSEMEHLFDGVTVREVERDSRDGCFVLMNNPDLWYIDKSWIMIETFPFKFDESLFVIE